MSTTFRKPFPHGIDITAAGGIERLLDFHRASFGDAQMNANGDPGEQNGDPAPATGDPDPAEPLEQPKPTPKPTETVDFWKGKAREQEKRAKENADAAKRLAELEGTSKEKAAEVDERDAQISQKDTELSTLRAENIVLRIAAQAGAADPDDLLDSRKFTESLAGIDATDRDAVKAHVEKFVEDNPRYAAPTGRVPAVRDAAWNARNSVPDPAANAAPGTARMAAGFEHKLTTRK